MPKGAGIRFVKLRCKNFGCFKQVFNLPPRLLKVGRYANKMKWYIDIKYY